ncbi:MAG: HPF/RaiA family ribosome-associated protein [Pseudomonadota bacterium]|uniref:HPF/RaiA family ribosome-associated protein n=1 Tax=Roseovarius TaxID=74030 RepID=UPI0022A8B8FC|nr:HPF/RaiA family ribosome-associated protein [Roseovarius sp. EGI FJ00037]MCZ0813051.1 HPF/RaiA family ribosome-associated protein [Roseovarius sp. EGI FJ00037]
MQTPIEIAFKHVEPTDELKALISEKAARLDKFHDGITSCHVYIRAPHQSQKTGNLYEITIEVRVPGQELAVRRHQDDQPERAHLKAAIRDAFSAMEQELKSAARKLQGDVKHHAGLLQGKIVEIRHDQGYGQIIASDNRLIYFHENSVVDGDFGDLAQGDPVEMVVQTEESAIGPQASTVRPIGGMEYDPGR